MHAQHSRCFWLLAVGIIQCLREYSHRKEAIATTTMHHLTDTPLTTVTSCRCATSSTLTWLPPRAAPAATRREAHAPTALPARYCHLLCAASHLPLTRPPLPVPLSAAVPRRWRPGWRLYRLRSWQVQWCSRRQLLLHLLPQEELLRGWLLVPCPVPCWHLRQQRRAG